MKTRKFLVCILLILTSLVFLSGSASAKTMQAPRYKLVNVTHAPAYEGEFVKVNGRKKFLRPDGEYLISRWVCVDDAIHYVDQDGNKFTGWVIYRGHRYRVKGEGLMRDGFFTSGGKTYYADEKGRVAANKWITVGKSRYYVNAQGVRLTGEQYIDGKWCYFKKNGKYAKNHVFKNAVDPSRPMIALTFDDGPGAYTDRLLDCLARNNARATFFMVGTSVPSYPSVIRRMVQLRCELGNHSDTHPYMTNLSSEGISSQYAACSGKIRAACGSSPTVCRLPYGAGHNVSWVLSSTGLPSIYWSVDTRDWANQGNPSSTISAALAGARNGAIILMHDIHYSTVVAAESIIPSLISQGYQLVTVSELARYKGKTTLTAGRTYYNFY